MNPLTVRMALLGAVVIGCVFGSSVPVPALGDNGTWVPVSGFATTPGARREHGAIFDAEHQRFVMFAGRSGNASNPYILFNDIWALDVSGTPAWSQVAITGAMPGERHSPQWGYDPTRNRVLIFGGYGSHYPGAPYEYLNDVWELSLSGTPTWTELFPSGQTPSGRLAGAAVYDPMRQRFVGFGGTIGTPVDTWVLNLRGQANWQPLPSMGSEPNGGYGMTSVYDARGDRMIMFGGSTNASYYGANNDVWSLSLRGVPTWTRITTAGTPPQARRSGTAIFDPLRNRMVIYGGFDAIFGSDEFLGDTWALDFNVAPPTWNLLAPGGTLPSVRVVSPAAYDPVHDRMILIGGWSGTAYLEDTQFLEWGGASQHAVLTPNASASPDLAHLEWQVAEATGTYSAVYRRVPGGLWTALAEAEVDPTGLLVYDDATVTPGSQYEYMMVVGSERGETFGGETLVQVPGAVSVDPGLRAGFALERVAPNPAVDRMSVSLVLRSAAPATLELVDVAGRRWLTREVGSMGAGAHEVELRTAGKVPSGVYFLRLSQGGAHATQRVAIVGK